MPATMRRWTNPFQAVVPVVSPPPVAANQYGTSAMIPIVAEARTAGSHHEWRVNSALVATTKPAIVRSDRMRVVAQRRPVVVTPLVAKAGVSHSQVVPARRRAITPCCAR